MFNLDKKNALIIGLGKTGLSIVRYLVKSPWDVSITVTDMKTIDKLPDEFQDLKPHIDNFSLGFHREEDFERADIIFVSPGVDLTKLPFTPSFSKEIINDIELAFRVKDSNFIGITGSNGKSTTTKLIYDLLRTQDTPTYLCGNYGIPILDEINKFDEHANLVCELSSFQLENIVEFTPSTALFLNLSEDHLDRYPSYQAYIDAKARIFLNSNPLTKIIYNLDDPLVKQIVDFAEGEKYSFSWTKNGDITSDGKEIVVLNESLGKQRFKLDNFKLKGTHHIENLMAALLTALTHKIPVNTIEEVIANFTGIPHRTEFVRELNGASYFNDSKATNVGATLKALEGFSNIILIAGGKDKGGSLDDLKPLIKERVKLLLLIGEATDRFHEEFKNLTECIKCKDFKDAVTKAHANAQNADNILLSPACASFDMFKNFEERGDIFKQLVGELK